MPLFSIIIPTRNRAHLLKYALESVVTQEFDDWELVVSDNISSDETQELVTSYSDRRVRYVRPPSYLPVHDHWNFAIQFASGQYIHMLGDDDCLASNTFSAFANMLKETLSPIVGCRTVDYYAKDYLVDGQKNIILVDSFTSKLRRIDTRAVLAEYFRFSFPIYFPKVQAVSISKTIVDAITQRLGHFFEQPFPEYVGFPMAFAMSSFYFFLDQPLIVVGRTPDSLGPKAFWFNLDPTWSESGEILFQYVPLHGTYWANGIAESLLRAKNNLPEKFEGIELDYATYYRDYYANMVAQRGLGRNIRNDLQEYYTVLESLPPDLRAQVRRTISPMEQPLVKKLFTYDPKTIWSGMIRRALSLGHPKVAINILPPNGYTSGDDVGVSDILSCAAWLRTLKPTEAD